MNTLKVTLFISFLLSGACGSISAANTVDRPKLIPQARQEATLSYAPVLKKVAPAVVNIYTIQHQKVALPNSPLLDDPFFKQFFERAYPEYDHEQISLGSGVIVNKEGYILTNYHVIENADLIQIALADKRQFIAKPIVMDKRTDLALLKIDGKGEFPYLSVSVQEDLEVGDLVLAIGNPFGIGQTVTHGIISALARSQEGINDFNSFIQTDAAINPGNSGGALVTTDGRLVGINTAIYSRSGGSMGIGFAIPTPLAISVIDSLKTGGHIIRPWLGLDVAPITIKTIGALGLEYPQGVLVKSVYPGGPGEKAGIKAGDVIAAIDEKEIDDKAAFDYRIAITPVGQKATVKIFRQGEVRTLPIQFSKPPEGSDPLPFVIKGITPLQGAKLRILSPALALDLGLNPMKEGVVIAEVEKEGVATRLGLLRGDILVSVNKKSVNTKKEAIALLQNKESSWNLVLKRGNKLFDLQIKG
ncbi:MAG: Do family serine endopeptidase [Alphaproteobacteria bacterium]|nr:Do family serine endopeptidase [Alphaproteobacteria bacterium]